MHVNPLISPPPIAAAAVPLPMFCDNVVLPYEIVVPYSKYAVVAAPLGSAVPVNVTLVAVIFDALPVVTVGGVTEHALVVNVRSEP